MKLGERIKNMGMFPDVGRLQGELNAKFEELISEIRQMKDILVQIRDQRGAPQ